MKRKDLFTSAAACVALTFGVMLAILCTSDSDLILWTAEHFGKSPASLSGQVVWVTGASSGIGEELVYILAAAGCRLVLSARREQALERVKQNCLNNHGAKSEDILVLPLDVLKFDTHQNAVHAVLKYFGHIDILVNNAGRSQRALITETSLEVDREILEVNTLGSISLTKAVLPHMMARQSGHIVAVSSMVGRVGMAGIASYVTSKHAMQGWFDTLRIEMYQENITVSVVCPGPVFSELYLHAATGKPGQELGLAMEPTDHRMATERCSRLIAVAMANQLDEAWISTQPELSYLYFSQYIPPLGRWIGHNIGAKRIQKMKAGKTSMRG